MPKYLDIVDTLMNPIDSFNEAIDKFFARLADGFTSGAMGLVKDYLIKSTDLDDTERMPIPMEEINEVALLLGVMLAFVLFYKRIMESIRDQVTGEAEPNYAEILGSFAVSLFFVVSCQTLINDFAIKIANDLTTWIADLPRAVSDDGDLLTTLPFKNSYARAEGRGIAFLVAILVWSIGFIGLAISAAIRYAELVFLNIVGPTLNGTYTTRSEVFVTFWIKTVSVVFTQPVQVFLLWGIMSSVQNLTWGGLILSFGFCILAIRGPKVLEQFLYSTGVGGASARFAGMAGYKLLAKAFIKR
ncbi:conjugal transfer protein TrbL family protein [Kroppenstedtia eburnea]|uniref:conjugal transfer protein TrbL family protein n=1 Tax=Kroppenstedtia eburnea TaxID=714067 RepID=UPI003627742B